MAEPAELRPWSSLSESERRMQAFLKTRGVSITEAEIRSPPRSGPGA
jgi:hypothetical protein